MDAEKDYGLYDFDWDNLAEATTQPYSEAPRKKRVLWEPSPEEIELAQLAGTIHCTQCNDAVELHDLKGCKVCGDCPYTWSNREIADIRKAYGLSWSR